VHPQKTSVSRRVLIWTMALLGIGLIGAAVWKAVPAFRGAMGAPTPGQVADAVKQQTPTSEDLQAERDRTRYRQVNEIRLALTDYVNDHKQYPTALTDLMPTYLKSVPLDPSAQRAYAYARDDSGFTLKFTLETGIFSYAAGDHEMTSRGIDVKPPTTFAPQPQGETTVTSVPAAPGTPAPQTAPDMTTDSDGDGLTDYQETTIYHTDPHKADTDGDGFSDGAEVKNGYDPNGPGKLPPVK
jgi:hypothetical protein